MHRWRAPVKLAVALCLGLPLLALLAPASGQAQALGQAQSEVLVLDADRLLLETKFGQALRREYEAERQELIDSNREIQAQLEAEEKDLTARRPTMTPQAFRALADAFDKKVQNIRDDNERIALDLELKHDQAPAVFLHRVQPVLAQLMQETGAVVILEANSVLLRSDSVDITDRAIKLVDETIGDGSAQ